MFSGHRRAGAATAVVFLLAVVLLLDQSPHPTRPLAHAVVPRFLGAEKDQEHLTHDDKESQEVKDEEKGQEQAASEQGGEPSEKQAGSANASSVADGQDEEDGSSAEALNATELGVYYDKVFDKIEGAAFLPPWFLVPVLLLAKQMITFSVFGFDMRFVHRDDPTGWWWYLIVAPSILSRAVCQLFFCALVVNGYRSDWVEYRSVVEMLDAAKPGDGISILENMALFIQVISTSGNFCAAAIVFVATLEQKYACGIPKYPSLPASLDTLVFKPFRFSVFPWVPFSARWMPKVKHLYMYLLLPYTIVPLLCNHFLTGIISWIHMCVFCKVTYGFIFCLPLTMLTLTLVPYFYDCTAEFATKLSPLWLLFLLQWQGAVCVMFVGLAWVLLKCQAGQRAALRDMIVLVFAGDVKESQGQQVNFLQQYASVQPDDTKEDFEWQAASQQETMSDPIDGELYTLMLVARKSLEAVVYTQISVLTCTRTLVTGHPFASYAAVMLGRSWEDFVSNLSAQVQDGMAQAMLLWQHRHEEMRDLAAALEVVSKTVNALWIA